MEWATLRLPASFFKKDKYNVAGGIEVGKASSASLVAPPDSHCGLDGWWQYGFSSTTLHQAQAEKYASVGDENVASTVLKAEMGMVDRGGPCQPPIPCDQMACAVVADSVRPNAAAQPTLATRRSSPSDDERSKCIRSASVLGC
jgi:hypothetical protein